MRKITFLLFVLYSFSSFGQSIYEKAVVYYDNGNFEKAVPLFKAYLEIIDDKDAVIDVEEYIAHSYNELDEFNLASEWSSKILEKDSLNELALFIALRVSVHNEDAEGTYKNANLLIENLEIKEAQTYYYRSLGLINFGETDSAFNDMLKAYELDSTQPGINYHLGLLYIQFKKYDKAIPLLTKSIDLNFEIDECLYNLALTYFYKEDYSTSKYFLNKTLDVNPDYLSNTVLKRDFNYMMGECYYNLGDYKNAVHYLEQFKDKEFENYERVFRITGLAYDELAKFYNQKEEYEKAAYFFAKKAEHIFNEGYIEDGLNHIDKAISLDSSIHYTMFKSQVMIFKIIYYSNESVFENYDEALSYSRKALELVYQVYADIFAIDPENEYYLNRYIEDLYFFNKLFNEPEIIGEICETYDKLESYDYDFDKKIRSSLCFNTGEKTIIDYDVMLFELESFEERFGVSLIEDE